MRLSHKLFVVTCLTVRFPTILSTPSSRATGELLDFYSHNAWYMNKRFQRGAHKALNHELYHHGQPVPSFAATLTSTSNTLQNGKLKVASASVNSKHVAAPETDVSMWKNQTQVACLKAIMAAHDVLPDSSGIAPCYNIPSFVKSTGSFTANLRLYAVSIPSDDWASAESQGMNVGVSFAGAKFANPNPHRAMRGLEATPIATTDQPRAIITRDTVVIPRYIRDLTFHGKITDYTAGENLDASFLRLLVTPNITLSGTTQQGTSMNTQLSCTRASFLVGFFVKPDTPSGQPVPMASADVITSKDMADLSSMIRFNRPTTGLIVTGVWALSYVAVTGHGLLCRIQARNHYRRRIRQSRSSGFEQS